MAIQSVERIRKESEHPCIGAWCYLYHKIIKMCGYYISRSRTTLYLLSREFIYVHKVTRSQNKCTRLAIHTQRASIDTVAHKVDHPRRTDWISASFKQRSVCYSMLVVCLHRSLVFHRAIMCSIFFGHAVLVRCSI